MIRVELGSLNLDPMRARAHGVPELVDRLVAAVMLRQASVAAAYMKGAAPWTDRTGNARGGLGADAASAGHTHTLTLHHGVAYGIWLEVRFGGRYAVVGPALEPQGRQVMALLDRGLARI